MLKALAFLFALNLFVSIAGIATGCGRAKAAGSATAIEIIGPAGFTCFAILAGDLVVGGNCVRN